ncbi:MAG: FKBP-type peptidyl-prolyl cis-trans isomerase [Candidatus Saccharibacteria bacterium]
MFINKYVAIGTASLLSIVVLAGAWVGYTHYSHLNLMGRNVSSLRESVYGESIPLSTDQSPPPTNGAPSSVQTSAPATGSNLGVAITPGASSLGQLDTRQPVAGSASNGSAGSATQEPDPTSFAQYDKYKSATSALFGDMVIGQGVALTANKKAAVYYKGWLTNGTLFDASRTGSDGKLQPFTFTLGAHQVIPGWEEGIAGMKVGGKRLIVVPPSVGYGAAGQGPIPANAVLVFEVQLLAVQD